MANPARLPMVRRSLRNLFSRPVTRRYPVEVRPRFAGARGSMKFDLANCVFCGLCARRCPAAAITVSREDKTFAMDQLRCIACGVCADVCNKKSLQVMPDALPAQVHLAGLSSLVRPGRREWRYEEPATPSVVGHPEVAGAAVATS
jgi:ech hydrogenase subunit F